MLSNIFQHGDLLDTNYGSPSIFLYICKTWFTVSFYQCNLVGLSRIIISVTNGGSERLEGVEPRPAAGCYDKDDKECIYRHRTEGECFSHRVDDKKCKTNLNSGESIILAAGQLVDTLRDLFEGKLSLIAFD